MIDAITFATLTLLGVVGVILLPMTIVKKYKQRRGKRAIELGVGDLMRRVRS